jgi:integrin alpha FG-GAP repeat containing protein 1
VSHAPHYTQSRLYQTEVGFESIGGTIGCFGDFNNDKYNDIFVISQNKSDVIVYLWNSNSYKFERSSVSIHYEDARIVGVSATDFNQDGKLDVLVQTHPFNMAVQPPSLNTTVTKLMVYFGNYDSIMDAIMLPEANQGQVAIFEFTGDLFPDLLGNRYDETGKLVSSVWINGNDGKTWSTVAFEDGRPLNNPHSVASVDFDGDCMPDLFLDRSDGTSEVWILNPTSGKFELKITFGAVGGRGQVSFGDFDGDGAVDLMFPVCYPASNCSMVNEMRMYYNVQKPICSGLFSKNCRKSTSLCEADSSFTFDNFASMESANVVKIPAGAFPAGTRLFTAQYADVPLMVRVGDYNVDRFVDLLVPLLPRTTNIAQTTLWKNIPCTNELCGEPATRAKRRTFAPVVDDSASALTGLHGAFGAAFFDLDESGSLDILVTMESTDSLNQHVMSLAAVTNNYFNDGYFVKTLGLNGLCTVNCGIKNIKLGQKPYGVNQHGACWKYTLSDLSGRQLVNAVPQLPQSAYSALQTPYVLSGLGRPSNYIDYVYYGVPVYKTGNKHFNAWPGIIPNSQVVVTPYPKNNPVNWAIELYISPSGALLWIALGVILCLLLSGAAIIFFQWREKKADEAEKKEREHLFSFNAM